MSSNIARPKPKKSYLPLDQLTFDPAFQLRGEPFNEEHVRRLVEVLEGGEEFDTPLDVVEVAPPGGKGLSRLYVIDGHNRGEAYRRRGTGSVACQVYPGTRADAELWALASNSKQPLARTPEDCRRAFDRLVSSPVLLARVIEHGRGRGGTERAVAAACGLSNSIVGKYLHETGLRSDRLTGKLIPLGEESPERAARQQLVTELADQGKTPTAIAKDLGINPGTVRRDMEATRGAKKSRAGKRTPAAAEPTAATEVGSAEDPVLAGAEAALAAFKSSVRAAGRAVEDLLRGRYAGPVRAALKAAGFPTEVTEREEVAPIGEKGPPKLVKVETWNLPAALVAAASDVQARLYSQPEL